MKKYWYLFKSNLAASLEYRGALFTWLLVELVSLTSSLFLWSAVFRTRTTVGSFDFTGILTYYLLIPIIGGFTSIFVSEHLPKKIKNGEISADLLKPYSIAFGTLINQFSIKLTQLTIKLPIYIGLGIFFLVLFHIQLQPHALLLAFGICLFSYILHFSMDLCLSYLAFWVDDVWSFSLLKQVSLMVFGGLSFPLSLLPEFMKPLFWALPFRFIYYFPTAVAQGSLSNQTILMDFSVLIAWTVGFLILGKILWQKGLKKYSAYGN
jgi:ABC-2 type transport system permease protein